MELSQRLRQPITLKPATPAPHKEGKPAPKGTVAELEGNPLHRIKQRCQRLAAEDEAFYRPDSQETRADLTPRIEELVRETALELGYPLSDSEVRKLGSELLDEIYGLGPLEPLLADPTISDILINTHEFVYVERNGRLVETDVRFISEEHLRNKVERMLYASGRRVDEASPHVDARLPDGSRVNIIIPPLAVDGTVVSIRRFPNEHLRVRELIAMGSLSDAMYEFLDCAIKAGANVIVCGGTGSGKTTTLNMLSGLIPSTERIVTIEDSAELRLQQRHVVRLESRPANAEGAGEISQRELLRNALRMRPDRIILGEVRGAEVMDMLQAMNTGHDGSMATLHANNPRDSLARMELMINLSDAQLPDRSIRRQIVSAIDLIIHIDRGRDGRRRIVSITEVAGLEQDGVVLQEIFNFEPAPKGSPSELHGTFRATGIRPRCNGKLELAECQLDPRIFADHKGV